MGVTDGQIYIIELRTLERLEFQYIPENIAINRTANIATIAVVGRNHPKYQYTGGETIMSFTLDFYSEQTNREDVFTRARWLESLAMNDGFKKDPSPLQVIWGTMFKKETWVLKNANYKLSMFHKFYNFLPQQCYIDLEFALDPSSNLLVNDIRRPFSVEQTSAFANDEFPQRPAKKTNTNPTPKQFKRKGDRISAAGKIYSPANTF